MMCGTRNREVYLRRKRKRKTTGVENPFTLMAKGGWDDEESLEMMGDGGSRWEEDGEEERGQVMTEQRPRPDKAGAGATLGRQWIRVSSLSRRRHRR
jgi:hypothetical protein